MPDAAHDAVSPLARAEIEHRIAGRMRLRVRARRGDAGFFRRVEDELARVPGVRGVRANPQTSGILIEHEGDEAAVLAAGRERGLFAVEPDSPASRPAPSPSAPGGAASPLDLAAVGLAGAGLLQLARGEIVGSASENLWNAYGLYAVTRNTLPSAFLIAFGLFQIARGEVLGSATSLFLYAYSARRLAQHRAPEEAV